MSVRAGIIVTGTEVLGGIIPDANGPWLSERLRAHGVVLSHTVLVADRPDDTGATRLILGSDLSAGHRPQLVVKPGQWQAARSLASAPGDYTLVGCTVAPGFDFRFFELAPG